MRTVVAMFLGFSSAVFFHGGVEKVLGIVSRTFLRIEEVISNTLSLGWSIFYFILYWGLAGLLVVCVCMCIREVYRYFCINSDLANQCKKDIEELKIQFQDQQEMSERRVRRELSDYREELDVLIAKSVSVEREKECESETQARIEATDENVETQEVATENTPSPNPAVQDNI